jgi:signal peptidase I
MTDDVPAAQAPRASAPPIGAADKKKTNWWHELRAIFFLILAVLAFHSLIAKPFYIPSESMMPGLLKGDRLVVSKYPYGWSWVSPASTSCRRDPGRLFGRCRSGRRGDRDPAGRLDRLYQAGDRRCRATRWRWSAASW